MAPISPPTWMQAGSYSARADRLLLGSLLTYPGFSADEATPLRIRQGVKPSYTNYQMKVRAAATPNMTVIVSAGYVYIENHDLAGYGAYSCVNDADYTVTIAAAGGAGQYRKDTIVASVYDAETAGATNEFRIEVIQGPYAASAGATVRGTLPPNAQVLADIALAPSQTTVASGNISDVRNYAVAAGGIVPITSGTDMSRGAPGQVRYRTDTDTFVYSNSAGTTVNLLQSVGASAIGVDQFVRKTVDEQVVSSSTLQNDDTLFLSVVANAVYTIDGQLFTLGDDFTADFKMGFTFPSGGEVHFSGPGPHTTVAAGGGGDGEFVARQSPDGISTAIPYASSTSRLGIPMKGLLITSATAGTLQLQWAQNTLGTGVVRVRAGSWLSITRRA